MRPATVITLALLMLMVLVAGAFQLFIETR